MSSDTISTKSSGTSLHGSSSENGDSSGSSYEDIEGQADVILPNIEDEEAQDEDEVDRASKVLLTMVMTHHLVLQQYHATLKRNGFDTVEAMRCIATRDLADMGVVVGHRHVLRTGLRRFFGEQWTFGVA